MKQAIGIQMGIDPAQFWPKSSLYSFGEYMSSLISSDKIKARPFHSSNCFIDGLCTINDDGELRRSLCEIYRKELELKVEHQGDNATFLNLDTTIKEGTFIYKLFDKRDSCSFSIVRMSHIERNIPENIFHSVMKDEFLRITRSTLCLRDFKGLLEHMKHQGFKRGTTGTSLRKKY